MRFIAIGVDLIEATTCPSGAWSNGTLRSLTPTFRQLVFSSAMLFDAMRDVIEADEVKEIAALFRQLPSLVWEAAISVRPDDSGRLKGEWLAKLRDHEVRVSLTIERIRQILES